MKTRPKIRLDELEDFYRNMKRSNRKIVRDYMLNGVYPIPHDLLDTDILMRYIAILKLEMRNLRKQLRNVP